VILDLHTHSIKSDDGRAKVQNYCQWIRTREIPIDGLVLTEHRQFDAESDYSPLAQQFGITILKGSEVETEYGRSISRTSTFLWPGSSKPVRCTARFPFPVIPGAGAWA
jgi:predicted metal-dependent phosphoesterase TrpH